MDGDLRPPRLRSLEDVLRHAARLSHYGDLFVQGRRPWKVTRDAVVAVLPKVSKDITWEDKEYPHRRFIRENKLRYLIDVPAVQDVVSNARAQRRGSMDDLTLAFDYYIGHDAFIAFEEIPRPASSKRSVRQR